jgi:hypothetical protein
LVAWQAVVGFGFPAQHHGDVVGPVSVEGLWLRPLTVAALVLVAAFALLRPFVGTPSTRSRWVVVAAATVAVIGELAMTRTGAGRLDAAAGVLPVVLVTGALAALMALDPGRRGRVSGFLPVVVGVLGLVLGTEPAAVGELLSGRWSGAALRASALVWVAALAWFALDGPERPAVSRTAWVASAVVALAVVAALPGFTAVGGQDAASGHMVQTTWTSGT